MSSLLDVGADFTLTVRHDCRHFGVQVDIFQFKKFYEVVRMRLSGIVENDSPQLSLASSAAAPR